MMLRRRRLLPAAVVTFALCAWILFTFPEYRLITHSPFSASVTPSTPQEPQPPPLWDDGGLVHRKPGPNPKPAPADRHPIEALVADAERELEAVLSRQSKTLPQAVAEYRRRYGIAPPPHFDKWFEFARQNGAQLVDEFDMIHDMLRPFWGLRPKTIRARVKEALGFDNFLMGVSVRDGKIVHAAGGPDWQRDSTAGMMAKFVRYLPSMDLAFNVHDEPRVVVPHDDLSRLVRAAVDGSLRNASRVARPANAFTARPDGLGPGTVFEETKRTRFNVFAHQPIWTHSRLSCPADSPARALEDEDAADDRSRYGLGELGFVYNVTAMSDICLSPSLGETHGFFDRPNAYNLVMDLVPVFSQSKMSSYADILYPSPWYWHNKVPYQERRDMDWEKKKGRLYWRGSTTGGFSRNGGWRRQHRQHFVRKINSAAQAMILVEKVVGGNGRKKKWEVAEVPRGDYKDVIDVYFSHVGQCDPGDCDAQRQFFAVQDQVDQQDAWGYKYLLDMDGNAFSGRFYAFLKSRSLVFKLAFFREWHFEWLRPWAHYVPLSLQGDDWLEAVRYFGAEPAVEKGTRPGGNGGGAGRPVERQGVPERQGEKEGERIAMRSREWAGKVLRNQDLEVWFFRLLLE